MLIPGPQMCFAATDSASLDTVWSKSNVITKRRHAHEEHTRLYVTLSDYAEYIGTTKARICGAREKKDHSCAIFEPTVKLALVKSAQAAAQSSIFIPFRHQHDIFARFTSAPAKPTTA